MKLKAPEDQRFFSVYILGEPSPVAEPETAVLPPPEEAPRVADERKATPGVVELDAEPPVAKSRSVVELDAESPVAKSRSPERKAEVRDENDSGRRRNGSDEKRARSRSRDELAAKRPRKSLPMPRAAERVPSPVNDPSLPNTDGLPPARPPSGPPGARPAPRGARAKGAAAAPRAVASSDVPAILREKIQAGEGIIRDAREAEDRNQWGQAFDCYQRGLAHFMEVLPKLGKDSPGGINLRQQINGYLTRAGELKEKLERSKAFGCRKLARPRGPASSS